jgi:selenocysteine lyase/cysteine desulfurase
MIDGARSRGFAVATPDNPEERGALVVVRCTDASTLVSRLEARGIVASARGTGLRVSFHAYNNDEDVDAVLAALDAEAALVWQAD